MTELDQPTAGRLAQLALDCVQREYPNKIGHVLHGDADVRPPRELTPAFYGCFDWHSAVHGHWLLARIARLFPVPLGERCLAVLRQNLRPETIAGEVAYLTARPGFERPYGLAWLLQLAAELRGFEADLTRVLEPLERLAAQQFADWLPKLSHPIRNGEHSQTAFGFGLALDWARMAGDAKLSRLLEQRSLDLYLADRNGPLNYEPSGHDFLSPCLAEADLLRRVLTAPQFSEWLTGFLPSLGTQAEPQGLLQPVVSPDPSDGKLAHLDGLNLSRAWMLEGIVVGLEPQDPRRGALLTCAVQHAEAGLASVTGEHYEGGHWLGTYAVYLLSGRGLSID